MDTPVCADPFSLLPDEDVTRLRYLLSSTEIDEIGCRVLAGEDAANTVILCLESGEAWCDIIDELLGTRVSDTYAELGSDEWAAFEVPISFCREVATQSDNAEMLEQLNEPISLGHVRVFVLFESEYSLCVNVLVESSRISRTLN